jgi:putative SOS response-associated peptidase YedK
MPRLDKDELLMNDFNVAPTRLVPALVLDGGGLNVLKPRWGLVPSWAKEVRSSSPLVNARSETIHEKPSFRDLIAGNRCIVPMNGFYEWDRSDARHKRPYFVPREDGHLMLCLGLWSRPKVLEGLESVAILTTSSGDDLAAIHDRAPVQVDASVAVEWLINNDDPLTCLTIERPRLAPRPVSSAVNSVRNNGPHLIEPGELQDPSPDGPLFG